MKESAKNYKTDGGDTWVITGTLEATPEAELIGFGGGGDITVVQEPGQSTTDIMSQKSVTDMVKDPTGNSEVINVSIDDRLGRSAATNNNIAIGTKYFGVGTPQKIPNNTVLVGGYGNNSGSDRAAHVGILTAGSMGVRGCQASVGCDVTCTGTYPTAIGYKTKVSANYGVAIGYLADCREESTVSFGDSNGNVWSTKRLCWVADPINPKEAANKNYVDIRVPIPPSNGTYILKSVDGITSWVSEEA